eukprot:1236483-Rhodomonas_salina.1
MAQCLRSGSGAKSNEKANCAGTKRTDNAFDQVMARWMPELTPMQLKAEVVEEGEGLELGDADLTLDASQHADPEKFAVSSVVHLRLGGTLELNAHFTSAERTTREIFQACDP